MSIDPSLIIIVAHTHGIIIIRIILHPSSSIRTFVPPLCQPIPSSNRAGRGGLNAGRATNASAYTARGDGFSCTSRG